MAHENETAPAPPGYRWFTGGVASWFAAFGMQGVLFAWILVGELEADPEWVGIAQTMSMLPSVFLLLIGGAIADRFDPRRLLLIIHTLSPLPVLGLAYAAGTDQLSIPVVLSFALCMGTFTAFGNPARDALLSRVAGPNLMNAVSGMTAVQFGAQALGAIGAGAARIIGTASTLGLHALILAAGTLFIRKVPRAPESTPEPVSDQTSDQENPKRDSLLDSLKGMREGLAIIFRTRELRGALMAIFAVGVLFVGPFSVVLPLMIREVYSGGVDQLALANMLFPLGTISGSIVVRVFGLKRKGRAMLIALSGGAILEGVLGTAPSFVIFCLATFTWGLAAAVFINCSRTIFQEHAPPAYRGRVLAAYQLGFTGGGPIGALASGYAISVVGLGGTFYLSGAAMALILLSMTLFTQVSRIE